MEAKYQLEIFCGLSMTYRMAHNHAELRTIAETTTGQITVIRNKRFVFQGNSRDLLTAIKLTEMEGKRL